MAIAASCTDTNTDTISTQGFSECYAVVTDATTGEQTVSFPVKVALELNWTQTTAAASYSGLVIDGNTYPQMLLNDLKWTTDQLWGYTTNNPSALLTTGATPKITDFNFRWSDRLDMPGYDQFTYDPAFVFGFKLDDRYTLKGARIPFSLWGTTTASAPGVNSFTSEVNNIVATPNFSKMTMTVLVNGAQFASAMPALNIQIDNIPMKIVNDGESFTFEADEIIPTLAGTPYPNYPCSNIKGTLNPREGMTFSFDCSVMQRMVYTVTTSPTVFGYR